MEYNLDFNNLLDIKKEESFNTDYIVEFNRKATSVLKEFKIDAEFSEIFVGPSVNRIEYKVEDKTNLSKLKKLSENISLTTGFSNIKILAPVPGKTVIGIEFPRKDRVTVGMKDILNSEEFNSIDKKIPICLGQNIVGEDIVEDLAKYPHLLVAGSTGSGKSICINSIIVSLLYRFSPKQLQLVLIDPKMVELSIYEGVPHLFFGKVITNTKDAINQLSELTLVMESRYEKLKKMAVKDIEEYNKLVSDKDKIPYIITVIDEFADLMLTAKKQVEDSVSRIVAMARAVGIHMIIATQRPSVDIITGVIKSNFPSRISCKVASNMDSRTILNQDGAEKLLGKGDMLIMTPNNPAPTRIQGTFISTDEIKEIVQNVIEVCKSDFIETHKTSIITDPLKEKIRNFIFSKGGKVSSPTIQREFRITLEKAEKYIKELVG